MFFPDQLIAFVRGLIENRVLVKVIFPIRALVFVRKIIWAPENEDGKLVVRSRVSVVDAKYSRLVGPLGRPFDSMRATRLLGNTAIWGATAPTVVSAVTTIFRTFSLAKQDVFEFRENVMYAYFEELPKANS